MKTCPRGHGRLLAMEETGGDLDWYCLACGYRPTITTEQAEVLRVERNSTSRRRPTRAGMDL